jgi:hypothetical protein
MKINLPVHSYEIRSRPASSAKLVNCFAELMPAGGKTPVMVTRAPGIPTWQEVGDGPIVAMYSAEIDLTTGYYEYLYVVSGSELYYVDSDKNVTLIGTVGDEVRVDIGSNTTDVVVVNEPNAFHWDGTTFEQILDDDLVSRGAGDVEFLDNFLLFRQPNSPNFFGADVGSATDFNALQFAVADSSPDDLKGIKSHHRILHAFGSRTLELYENTGASGFPFERIVNATIQMGCLNPATVAEIDNILIWLADDYSVRRLDGITPVKISNPAIDQAVSAATTSTGRAFTYEQDGHYFYVLTFDEGTYAYDLSTGEWAERKTYNENNWKINCHEQFAGKELVGDSNSNRIGYLSFDEFTDWGTDTTNLIRSSGKFANAIYWTPGGDTGVTDAYAVGPNGTTHAAQILDDSGGGTGNVTCYQGLTLEAGTQYVFSIKAKPDQLDWVYLLFSGFTDMPGDVDGYFDLANGQKGTIGSGIDASGMIPAGNGYYRCYLVVTTVADVTGFIQVYAADADADITVALDGTSSILLADAQMEKGKYPTTYESTDSPLAGNQTAVIKTRVGTQRMQWTYQTVYADGQRAFHKRLEIILETGIGTETGQGSAPKLMLQYSDDGGRNWKSAPDRAIGATGKTLTRCVWYGLGSSRDRVYRCAVSDPIPVTVVDTILEVDGGRL